MQSQMSILKLSKNGSLLIKNYLYSCGYCIARSIHFKTGMNISVWRTGNKGANNHLPI